MEESETDIRVRIATLLARRCNNCYSQLQGYQVKGDGWNWLTCNVGPFCNECFAEIKPLLKEPNNE